MSEAKKVSLVVVAQAVHTGEHCSLECRYANGDGDYCALFDRVLGWFASPGPKRLDECKSAEVLTQTITEAHK